MKNSPSKLLVSGVALILAALFFPVMAQAQASRSIRKWTHCDGKTDDDAGVAAAFDAAKNGAFTLVVDCPVFIHVGYDIRRPIYIDNGTTVQFTAKGLFKVDNVEIPTFVIANSSKVRLLGWNVQYVGGLPIDMAKLGGYYDNGVLKHASGPQPSGAFSDIALSSWLTAHRGIHYLSGVAPWGGWTNTAAIFYLVGSVNDLQVLNMKAFVAPQTKGSRFIPMLFSSIHGYKSNQSVSKTMPVTSQIDAVPNNVTFSNIDLDGYYMGWQGTFQNTVFEHIRAHRYGDLQDDNGGNVGGVGKWFAPPHLLYISYDAKQTGLENRNIRILDVIDYGNRVGVARDKGGSDPGSGFANSIKFGGIDCVIDGYKSYRPDGFLDLLSSRNVKISNVDVTYDSSFLHGIYPAIRFPQIPYEDVTFTNVRVADKAAAPTQTPVWGQWNPHNSGVSMTNFQVKVNSWAKPLKTLCPPFNGTGNKLDLQYTVGGRSQECRN